jgi:hypothetical protein
MHEITPVDALWFGILNASLLSDRPKYNRPGAIVEKLPERYREALKGLSSKDMMNDRPDYVAQFIG